MLHTLYVLVSAFGACDAISTEKFLPERISTDGAHEGLDWISADESSVIFTRATPDFSASRLMRARKRHDTWVVDQLPISSSGYDAGLSIAPSELHVFFTSTRKTDSNPAGNWNLWYAGARRVDADWFFDSPVAMPAPVNTAQNECCIVHGAGDDFYFSSDRQGSWDIYHAKPEEGGYSVSLLGGGLNTSEDAWPSTYLSNPSRLIFSSIRESGVGGDDIYISNQTDGVWSPGRLLGAGINQSGYQDSARVFGQRLYWSSRPETGENTGDLNVSDIYTMPTPCIDELG